MASVSASGTVSRTRMHPRLGLPSIISMPDPRQLPRCQPPPAIHAFFRDGHQEQQGQGEGARDAQLARIEAVLFLADEPMPIRRLVKAAQLKDAAEARRQVRRLQSLFERDGSAFDVVEVAGGFQLLTRPHFYRWLARLHKSPGDLRLSGAALETLAVISYRQPLMRADIEAVRGVQCGDLLRFLMERGLIRIAGRHDSLGRPVLYGTTRKFLQVFGLKSLRELPGITS